MDIDRLLSKIERRGNFLALSLFLNLILLFLVAVSVSKGCL